MPQHNQAAWLKTEMEKNLCENILPFWINHAPDTEHGGFIGGIRMDNQVVPGRPKAAVITARLLWTFSAAYRVYQDERYRAMAQRAYDALSTQFWDTAAGGVYWLLDAGGAPLDTTKHLYAQSFALYGLCEFYQATALPGALERASALFDLIETKAKDSGAGGYYEAFTRDWARLSNSQMLADGTEAVKTMNTHLHLLEAYTQLVRVRRDPETVAALRGAYRLMADTVIDPVAGHMKPYFDEAWHSISPAISFGHDIEASWLIYEAAQVLGDEAVIQEARGLSLCMAKAVYKECFRDGFGIPYEAVPGEPLNGQFDWWVQAEAVVGFFNAYVLSGQAYFLDAACAIWRFIDTYLVDHTYGEWRKYVTPSLSPCAHALKADEWKCPYHNGRACLEIVTRQASGR